MSIGELTWVICVEEEEKYGEGEGVGVGMCVLASPSCSKLAKLIQSLAVVWCHLLVLMCFYGCSLMPTMADGKHSFFFLFWDRVSGSSGWPRTSSVVEGYLNSAPSLAFRLSVWDHRHVLPCPAVGSDSRILSPSIPTSMGKAVIAVTWEAEAEGLWIQTQLGLHGESLSWKTNLTATQFPSTERRVSDSPVRVLRTSCSDT